MRKETYVVIFPLIFLSYFAGTVGNDVLLKEEIYYALTRKS